MIEVSETEWQHNRIERDLLTVNNKSANASVQPRREHLQIKSILTNVKQSFNHTDTNTEIQKINKKNTATIETMITSVHGLSEKTAQEYYDYGKAKKKPLTERAWKAISKALSDFIAIGGTPDQVLGKAMDKDWIGLEAE